MLVCNSMNRFTLRMYLIKHTHFNAPQHRELYQNAALPFKRGARRKAKHGTNEVPLDHAELYGVAVNHAGGFYLRKRSLQLRRLRRVH